MYQFDVPPLRILWLLRSGGVHDFPGLLEALHIPNTPTVTGSVVSRLSALRNAGLIDYDTHGGGEPSGEITLSPTWQMLQAALDVSLTELSKLGAESMIVTPHFRRPNMETQSTDIFVMMPFDDAFRPVYDDHIVPVVRDLDLTVMRGDDVFAADAIIDDIWCAVVRSRALIADCTGRNPNVFYEIGLAHAVGRPVILITQGGDDVPFDIGHLRYIEYENTSRGMQRFEQTLAVTLKSVLHLAGQQGQEAGFAALRRRLRRKNK